MGLLISKSDIGTVRVANEDFCWSGKNSKNDIMLVVCDGLGSYEGSHLASKIAVKLYKKEFLNATYNENNFEQWFLNIIDKIKSKFNDEIKKVPKYGHMSTTIVLSIIIKHNIHTFWIGDSRAYLISKKKINQLTEDHNLLNYLKKVNAKQNVFIKHNKDLFSITHFIDAKPAKQGYGYIKAKLKHGDVLMLCSDGLYNFVNIENLYPNLSNIKNPKAAADEVIQMAINNCSDDNITFASFYNGK